MSNSNTALWDAVFRTDPKHTRPFQRSGGFKGTAIDPMYLIGKATATFGPVGIGWGFEEVEHRVEAGIWFSKVRVWYIWNGQRGQVEQWGATVLQGTNKHGGFVDEEAAKKSVTDALTKAMSYIGFAADVHSGRYDDNKYVAELRQEFAEEKQQGNGQQRPTQSPPTNGHANGNGTNQSNSRPPTSSEYMAFGERVKTLLGKWPGAWKDRNEVKAWVLEDQEWLANIGIVQPNTGKATWQHVEQCNNAQALDTILKGIEEETLSRTQGREQGAIN